MWEREKLFFFEDLILNKFFCFVGKSCIFFPSFWNWWGDLLLLSLFLVPVSLLVLFVGLFDCPPPRINTIQIGLTFEKYCKRKENCQNCFHNYCDCKIMFWSFIPDHFSSPDLTTSHILTKFVSLFWRESIIDSYFEVIQMIFFNISWKFIFYTKEFWLLTEFRFTTFYCPSILSILLVTKRFLIKIQSIILKIHFNNCKK